MVMVVVVGFGAGVVAVEAKVEIVVVAGGFGASVVDVRIGFLLGFELSCPTG